MRTCTTASFCVCAQNCRTRAWYAALPRHNRAGMAEDTAIIEACERAELEERLLAAARASDADLIEQLGWWGPSGDPRSPVHRCFDRFRDKGVPPLVKLRRNFKDGRDAEFLRMVHTWAWKGYPQEDLWLSAGGSSTAFNTDLRRRVSALTRCCGHKPCEHIEDCFECVFGAALAVRPREHWPEVELVGPSNSVRSVNLADALDECSRGAGTGRHVLKNRDRGKARAFLVWIFSTSHGKFGRDRKGRLREHDLDPAEVDRFVDRACLRLLAPVLSSDALRHMKRTPMAANERVNATLKRKCLWVNDVLDDSCKRSATNTRIENTPATGDMHRRREWEQYTFMLAYRMRCENATGARVEGPRHFPTNRQHAEFVSGARGESIVGFMHGGQSEAKMAGVVRLMRESSGV